MLLGASINIAKEEKYFDRKRLSGRVVPTKLGVGNWALSRQSWIHLCPPKLQHNPALIVATLASLWLQPRGEPTHPIKERPHSLSHYPELMTTGEGWNLDWPHLYTLTFAQYGCYSNQSVGLMFHLSIAHEQHPEEIPELLHLDNQLVSNQQKCKKNGEGLF